MNLLKVDQKIQFLAGRYLAWDRPITNLIVFFLFPIETILNHQDFQTTWESVYSAVPSVPELDLVSQFSNVSTNNISATSTTIRTTSTTSNVPDLVYPVSAKVAKDPIFNYIVPKSSRYVILLERTSIMNINQRWTNIRRALYR